MVFVYLFQPDCYYPEYAEPKYVKLPALRLKKEKGNVYKNKQTTQIEMKKAIETIFGQMV